MKDYSAEINAAVRALGDIALEESKRICPVRTGRLRRSIALRENYSRAKNETSIIIGTTVPYARNVELGGKHNVPRHYLGGGLEKAHQRAGLIFSLFLGGV